MPTNISVRHVEQRTIGVPFVLAALVMWALSVAVFSLNPAAVAEMGAAADVVSP